MKTPAFEELMGGYFHQDWDLDGTESEVIDLFMAHHPDLAPRLAEEIEAVLQTDRSEAELRSLLLGMGCQRLPDPALDGYRSWLRSLAHQARAHFAEPA